MPSASVMTRESSDAGLRLVEVGDRQPADVRWTARRISVIERWAALPRTWERAKAVSAWRRVARAGHQNDLRQQLRAALADDVVEQELGRAGQDEPAEAVDEEKPESESEAALPGRDELRGVPEDDLEGEGLFLLVLIGPGGPTAAPLGFHGPGGETSSAEPQARHGQADLRVR